MVEISEKLKQPAVCKDADPGSRCLEIAGKLTFLGAPQISPVGLCLDKDLWLTILQHRIIHPFTLFDAW